MPPAGTSSPGYTSCPANVDNSRNGVPVSMSAVIRLWHDSISKGSNRRENEPTLLVAFSLGLYAFLEPYPGRPYGFSHGALAYAP